MRMEDGKTLFTLWTHKRHPIPRPYGCDVGCLFWALWRKYIEAGRVVLFRVNDSSTVAWINNTGDNVVGSTDGNTVSNTGDNAVGNATGNISSTSVHTGRNHTRSPGVLVGLDLMEQTGGRVSLPLNHSLYFSRLELWDSGNYSCWSHGMVHLVAQITGIETVFRKAHFMTLYKFPLVLVTWN